jgi:antitoxin ParD1/3/4
MGLVKKTVNITDQQDGWIKTQIKSGLYGNESEVIRELIRERQVQAQETRGEIEAIRAALIDGEQSGLNNQTLNEIWAEARK